MKRAISLLLCLALLLGLPAMSALAAAPESGLLPVTDDISVSADYDWTRFMGKKVTLNVYNWGEYISDGSDGSANVIAAFEQLTGIHVNYTTFDSNESMYAKMKSGAADYDVIVPSDYMVSRMIGENMLAPLDYANIPNYGKIDDAYKHRDYDPDDAYSVPYMWCTTGIIYNTTMVDTPPTSWADLWNPAYSGNILMFNNSRDAFAIAAFKLGQSINPTTDKEVSAGIEELKQQKPLVQAYVMDEIFDKMEGGEAAVGVYYSGDAITMIDDNPDLAWVFPKEGVNLSIDNMCIPASSQNKEAAEMFLNYMCETDVGVANCEYIGYSTPMTAVWENLDDDLKNSEIAYPSDEVLAKTQVFTNLSDETNAELDAQWSALKSYNESGNAWMVPVFLALAIALASFNIWRKLRKKMHNPY